MFRSFSELGEHGDRQLQKSPERHTGTLATPGHWEPGEDSGQVFPPAQVHYEFLMIPLN